MAFWDTSAVVPLCCHQEASVRVRQLLREHTCAVWWGARVEVCSTLARLHRQGVLTTNGLAQAKKRLETLQPILRELMPTDRERTLAEDAAERYALRALDAFQLAAALVWCSERPRRRPFICLDARLANAAEQAGFQVLG